jgi:hypothetical protein
MKKVSTAATKQTNDFGERKLTIGLDLGDRSSWYCMLDGSGAVLLEQKLGTAPKAMQEVVQTCSTRSKRKTEAESASFAVLTSPCFARSIPRSTAT